MIWHRTKDLVGLPGMPAVARPIQASGASRGWVCREVSWGRRTVLEWLESSLPEITQAALRQARGEEMLAGSTPCPPADGPAPALAGPSIPCGDDGPVARFDARVEILTAFRRWWAESGKTARDKALREWCAIYKKSGASVSDETRAAIPSVGWSTVRGWIWDEQRSGAMALLPGAGGRTSIIDADPAMRAVCASLLFERDPHITAKQIRRVLAADFRDRPTPSIAAIRYWVRRWRRENRRSLSAVTDPDKHKSGWMPAMGKADADIDELNQLWELDSTKIDVMCADGRRYTLVAGIDVWSRRAKAIVAPTSRSVSVALLLRRCLLDWGVPKIVRTDEGADYVSNHLCAIFDRLDVLHDILPPYSPDQKPHIERFMRTIGHDLFVMLPGFVGHNVADREAIRSRWSFAGRRGQNKTITFACDLTPEQLQEQIDGWCENVYGRETHSGLGGDMTPFEKAASWTGERRRVDERGLDILLAEPAKGGGWRTVQKDGLSVAGGLYIAGRLGLHVKERVQVRLDPADFGRVFAFDATGRFICVAEDPLRTGIDPKEVAREARALARGLDRAARKHARELAKVVEPEAAMSRVLAHAAEDSARVVPFPAAGEVHRTDDTIAAEAAAAERDKLDALDKPDRAAVGMSHGALFRKFQELEALDD